MLAGTATTQCALPCVLCAALFWAVLFNNGWQVAVQSHAAVQVLVVVCCRLPVCWHIRLVKHACRVRTLMVHAPFCHAMS